VPCYRKLFGTDLRQLISTESAANDGLGYAFFAIYLTVGRTRERRSQGLGSGWDRMYVFFASVLLMNRSDLLMNEDQMLLGVVIGALLGWLFSKIMKYAHRLG